MKFTCWNQYLKKRKKEDIKSVASILDSDSNVKDMAIKNTSYSM